MSSHLACLLGHCLESNKQKTGGNCSWHDFASSILTSRISALCLYGAIQLCTKHMAEFLVSLELSPSPKQMANLYVRHFFYKLIYHNLYHTDCIISICNKTNTNLLHTNLLHSILSKNELVIQIVVHQFVYKTTTKKRDVIPNTII
jgi:hypothetical protein